MSKGGRPTDYREGYIAIVINLALLGLTDKQMASAFDVSEQTFNAWKNKYPEFLASIKEGKERADAKVIQGLYNRATGYEYKEDYVEKVKIPGKSHINKKGELIEVGGGERLKKYVITKRMAPDVTAQIYWLKNRQPEHWRDKKDVEHTGRIITGFEFTDIE